MWRCESLLLLLLLVYRPVRCTGFDKNYYHALGIKKLHSNNCNFEVEMTKQRVEKWIKPWIISLHTNSLLLDYQEINFIHTLNRLLTHTCHVLPDFPSDFPFSLFVFPGKQLVFFAVGPIRFLRLFISWVIKTIPMGQDLSTIKNLSVEKPLRWTRTLKKEGVSAISKALKCSWIKQLCHAKQ